LAGAHALLLGGGGAFLALPTPWRRLRPARGTPSDDGVPFESLRLGDGSSAWLAGGSGEGSSRAAVCLCHGRSRSKAWLRPLIGALAPEYAVLAFDFPGHGENPYGWTTVGRREADTVDHALELLAARGYTRVLLYGCSMGGAAALLSQGRHPHPSVQGLVTDGTFAAFPEVLEHRAGWVPAYLRLGALCVAGMLAGYDPWAVRPIDSVAGVAVPVLLLHGDEDHLVPPDTALRMAGQSPRANAQLYHGRHDEPANAEMQAAVRAFAADVL